MGGRWFVDDRGHYGYKSLRLSRVWSNAVESVVHVCSCLYSLSCYTLFLNNIYKCIEHSRVLKAKPVVTTSITSCPFPRCSLFSFSLSLSLPLSLFLSHLGTRMVLYLSSIFSWGNQANGQMLNTYTHNMFMSLTFNNICTFPLFKNHTVSGNIY